MQRRQDEAKIWFLGMCEASCEAGVGERKKKLLNEREENEDWRKGCFMYFRLSHRM